MSEGQQVPVKPTRAEIQARLDAELQRRLWACYDAAYHMCNGRGPGEEPSAEDWAALYRAVGGVPSSQRPRE